MTRDEIKAILQQVIDNAFRRGPSWAQEGVILRTVAERLSEQGDADLASQQAVLDIWHDLFADRELAWGYNFDNPGAPFFHRRQTASSEGNGRA